MFLRYAAINTESCGLGRPGPAFRFNDGVWPIKFDPKSAEVWTARGQRDSPPHAGQGGGFRARKSVPEISRT